MNLQHGHYIYRKPLNMYIYNNNQDITITEDDMV
jgi:hypothetical protein